jgi:hypothetical protein
MSDAQGLRPGQVLELREPRGLFGVFSRLRVRISPLYESA